MRWVRYPALWKRVSPDDPDQRDFRWTNERLGELKRLGFSPILTLCHHGSGPRSERIVQADQPGYVANAVITRTTSGSMFVSVRTCLLAKAVAGLVHD